MRTKAIHHYEYNFQDDYVTTVEAAARGDGDAFRRLYDAHSGALYGIALRWLNDPALAEDVCQEAWLHAHRELPKLRNPQAFTSWLQRIVVHGAITALRGRRRAALAFSRAPIDDVLGTAGDPERLALQRERVSQTWESLAAVPARQHTALFLREIEGRSYREIAEVLDTSESAVEGLLFRARQALHKQNRAAESGEGSEGCSRVRQMMAVLIDGGSTRVQRLAVDAHIAQCLPCCEYLGRLQGAADAAHSRFARDSAAPTCDL